MHVVVVVVVVVIDPLIVAALVNGNDVVDVIHAVDCSWCKAPNAMRTDQSINRPPLSTGPDHPHGVVPVHERGHDQGVDHVHVHDHDHVHVLLASRPL